MSYHSSNIRRQIDLDAYPDLVGFVIAAERWGKTSLPPYEFGNGEDYYASVQRGGDWQRSRNCVHSHRTIEAADRCCRRLIRKVGQP